MFIPDKYFCTGLKIKLDFDNRIKQLKMNEELCQDKAPEPRLEGIRSSETAVCQQTETVSVPKYEIYINTLDMGYTVRVGCQTVAIQDVETLIAKLSEYLRNPAETQQKYNNKTLFK